MGRKRERRIMLRLKKAFVVCLQYFLLELEFKKKNAVEQPENYNVLAQLIRMARFIRLKWDNYGSNRATTFADSGTSHVIVLKNQNKYVPAGIMAFKIHILQIHS